MLPKKAVWIKSFLKKMMPVQAGFDSGALGYSLGGPLSTITELSLNDRLYLVQEEVIKGVACEGSCVIVGRCADYVLRDRSDVLNVYIHADMEDRKERAVHSYEVMNAISRAASRKSTSAVQIIMSTIRIANGVVTENYDISNQFLIRSVLTALWKLLRCSHMEKKLIRNHCRKKNI